MHKYIIQGLMLSSIWSLINIAATPSYAVDWIITKPTGEQIVERGIHPLTTYFDKARVAWDTRKDGPLPEPMPALGGLYKCGENLCVNAAQKDLHDAAVSAREAAEANEVAVDDDLRTRREQVRALLADWDSVTAAQLKQIIRWLVKKELRQ